jgi:Zn-dependent protease
VSELVFGRTSRGLAIGVPKDAFRPSGVFLGLVALFITGGVMAWRGYGNPSFDVFVFVVAGWLVSLCLHEYAHALLAFRAGDVAVAARGYLKLNPLKYTHPLLSIVLPVLFLLMGGIGLPGGAVWVDRHAIRDRLADSLISAAGPAVNVVFALGLLVPFLFDPDTQNHPTFWAGLGLLAFLQVTASLLNLAPVPGVDGGNLIRPWLSSQWQRGFDLIAPYGMLLLIAALFQPIVNNIFFTIVFGVTDLLGLPANTYFDGLDLLQFWK